MSGAHTQASPGRRRTLLVAKIGVSVALLSLLLSRADVAGLWTRARGAAPAWLLLALGVYFLNVLASTWRWRLLLNAQGLHFPWRTLLGSYLVAGFFNNFLPSNIGGDVVRIRDTARLAQSTTLAATVVLVDRGLGLMGLVLVAAVGATAAGTGRAGGPPIWPSWLWAGFLGGAAVAAPAVMAPAGVKRLLRPLTILHPEWIGERIDRLTAAMTRFRERPGALASCFAGAVLVQALLVLCYATVGQALGLRVSIWDLAVVVPLSFLVQMLPISLNGLGVREAAFSFYFARLGLAIEPALVLSLMAAGLVMVFSLSGAALYVARGAGGRQVA